VSRSILTIVIYYYYYYYYYYWARKLVLIFCSTVRSEMLESIQ